MTTVQELQDRFLKATQTPWRNFLKEAAKGITITIDNHDLSENAFGTSLFFEVALRIGEEEKYRLTERINFDPNDPVCFMDKYAESAMNTADGLFSLFFFDLLISFLAKNELGKLYAEVSQMQADLEK